MTAQPVTLTLILLCVFCLHARAFVCAYSAVLPSSCVMLSHKILQTSGQWTMQSYSRSPSLSLYLSHALSIFLSFNVCVFFILVKHWKRHTAAPLARTSRMNYSITPCCFFDQRHRVCMRECATVRHENAYTWNKKKIKIQRRHSVAVSNQP